MSHPLTPYALSVLIPVYNEENTIAALLESVLSAPLPPGKGLEIVAVDDASRDSSPELLREYAERDRRSVTRNCEFGCGAVFRGRPLNHCDRYKARMTFNILSAASFNRQSI